MFSKYISQLKQTKQNKTRAPGRNHSRSGARNVQEEPGTSCPTKTSEIHQKLCGLCQKDSGALGKRDKSEHQ